MVLRLYKEISLMKNIMFIIGYVVVDGNKRREYVVHI
jgi:hypothetical protein